MSVRFRTSVVDARTALRLGSSAAALGAALVFAAPAFAQASTHIDDPRDSSSSAANPNEAANAAAQKRANANLTGDLTPAQTDNAAQAGAQAVTAAMADRRIRRKSSSPDTAAAWKPRSRRRRTATRSSNRYPPRISASCPTPRSRNRSRACRA